MSERIEHIVLSDGEGNTEGLHVVALGERRYAVRNIPFFLCDLHIDDEIVLDDTLMDYEIVRYSGYHTLRIECAEGTTSLEVEDLVLGLDATGITGEGNFGKYTDYPALLYALPVGYNPQIAFRLLEVHPQVEGYIVY